MQPSATEEWRSGRRIIAYALATIIVLIGISIVLSVYFRGVQAGPPFTYHFFPFGFGWMWFIFGFFFIFWFLRWVFWPWKHYPHGYWHAGDDTGVGPDRKYPGLPRWMKVWDHRHRPDTAGRWYDNNTRKLGWRK